MAVPYGSAAAAPQRWHAKLHDIKMLGKWMKGVYVSPPKRCL